ncbi:MAG TPA: hypothetical protein VKU84_10480 [Stellaceae bacterium]|nr:hypothetical protein [Stellaceae bacterium]
MDSDDPDILSFGSIPPPARRFGPVRRLAAMMPGGMRRVGLPAAGAAGLAVAGLAVACVALTSVGTAQPHHAPTVHSIPAVTMKYQAGVSGFLRAELPAVRLSSGQTVPLRTIATSSHCHHQ